MFVACGIWCLADVSSVSPSSEQTQKVKLFAYKTHINKVQKIQNHSIRLIFFAQTFGCQTE